MKTQSLFHPEDHKQTDDARNIDRVARVRLNGIFDTYMEMGFSPREISHVLIGTVFEIEALKCL